MILKEKVSTAVLYDAEYDTQKQTLPFVWCSSKRRQTPLVWCWIWLREANVHISVMFNMTQRQTLPFCVKLRFIQTLSFCTITFVMTQRNKPCHLVWWAEYETDRQTLLSCVILNMTPRGKLQWKCVKRWWEECPRVVSTNSDIRKTSRWAFVWISVSVRWAHVRLVGFCPVGFLPPYAQPGIAKGKLTHFLSRWEPKVFFPPTDTVSPRSFSPCMIRLEHQFCCAWSVDTTFDDLDVIDYWNVWKVKLHSHWFFFGKFLFGNVQLLNNFTCVNGSLKIAFYEFESFFQEDN